MMLKSSSDTFITAVRFAEECTHVERQFIRRSSIRQNCVRYCPIRLLMYANRCVL